MQYIDTSHMRQPGFVSSGRHTCDALIESVSQSNEEKNYWKYFRFELESDAGSDVIQGRVCFIVASHKSALFASVEWKTR